MAAVHVYLLDGFSQDQVTIRADGRVVFEAPDVTTKRLLGYAKKLPPIEAGASLQLQLELPQRAIRSEINVDLQSECHVAISVEGGQLKHFVSAQRLGFA